MAYLVEYILKPGDSGYGEKVGVSTLRLGRVSFDPNPEFGDRRIAEVPSSEDQQELLNNGNVGMWGARRAFVVPPDAMKEVERLQIEAIVDARVQELGLIKPQAEKPTRRINRK